MAPFFDLLKEVCEFHLEIILKTDNFIEFVVEKWYRLICNTYIQFSTGADLTHLDQCFLVIVSPQGFATNITHLNITDTERWELFFGDLNVNFRPSLLTHYGNISKFLCNFWRKRDFYFTVAIVSPSALTQKRIL